MKAAIYLIGHGPYREPRLIELQNLRVLRYINLYREVSGNYFSILNTYVDINYPRSDYLDDLPNLKLLIEEILDNKIDTVFLDIEIGKSFKPYENYSIIATIEKSGAKVYNCFYDTDDVMLTELRKHFGNKVNEYYLPQDDEDVITLFPAIAANITFKIIGDSVLESKSGSAELLSKEIYEDIRILRNESPYKGSNLPILNKRTGLKLMKLKEEEKNERKLVEDVYIINPNDEGRLWDEYVFGGGRNYDGFEWIKNRIIKLGFNHKIIDNRHSFVMEYKGFFLFADPRISGGIEISIFEKETKSKSKNVEYKFVDRFKILDGWKNDLKGKLVARVENSIQSV